MAFNFGTPANAKKASPFTFGIQAGSAPGPSPATTPSGREHEGTVQFASLRSLPTFRYRISAKSDKVQFWLEDTVSKKQWQSDKLGMDEFVKSDAVIPMAGFDDYISCFHNCLAAPLGDLKRESARDLVTHGTDAWELQLTLNIKVFASVWSPKYSFILKEVPLQPLDILAAQVRDQDDEIKEIGVQVAELTSRVDVPRPPPSWIRAVTVQQFSTNQTLVWKMDKGGGNSRNAISILANGRISLNVPGIFMVAAVIVHNNNNNNIAVELLHNNARVVGCMDSNGNSHRQASPIYHILAACKSDELSVVYKGNNCAETGSYINIAQLH